MKLLQTGVYCIRHKRSGKRYVGSAARSTLLERWADHLKRLRGGYHYNKYLQRAWNKHGEDAFEFIILERCPSKKCVEREQYWMDKLKAYKKRVGYNGTPKAGSQLGFKHSEKTRRENGDRKRGVQANENQRAALDVGRHRSWHDPFLRAKRIASLQLAAKRPGVQARKSVALKGHAVSDETRKRMSESAKGKIISPAQRTKIAAALRGRKLGFAIRPPTSEMRKRAAESRKGTPAWNKGVVMGEDFSRKISQAMTPEVREKISKGRKAYWAKLRGQHQ